MALTLVTGDGSGIFSESTAQAKQAPAKGRIVAVGDSLTAGYGVAETDAYPAQLQRKLKQAGYDYEVVNAGISGETSSGTLSRIPWILKLKPAIVIVETGANDGIRGISPKVIEENLDRIVSKLLKNNVVVVLAGMEMFPNLGREYVGKFAQAYRAVATKHRVILIPFFLRKVAGEPSLNQGDRIHPTAAGYRIVTETIFPYVVQAIDKSHSNR